MMEKTTALVLEILDLKAELRDSKEEIEKYRLELIEKEQQVMRLYAEIKSLNKRRSDFSGSLAVVDRLHDLYNEMKKFRGD